MHEYIDIDWAHIDWSWALYFTGVKYKDCACAGGVSNNWWNRSAFIGVNRITCLCLEESDLISDTINYGNSEDETEYKCN